ncbi:MAG: hemerythrin domain-containing protein [Rhodocyclaceae bacterium]|nr:hemerythrin domain-containing protein [Rhodocyclaceae bacterium]
MQVNFQQHAGAGIDQPLAALSACHQNIRVHLDTLLRLVEQVPRRGADSETLQQARGVVDYFGKVLARHHADEEECLLPMLQNLMPDRGRAALDCLQRELIAEHEHLLRYWELIASWLRALEEGKTSVPDWDVTARFVTMYRHHLDAEEYRLLPLAERLLGPADLASLAHAMAERRVKANETRA